MVSSRSSRTSSTSSMLATACRSALLLIAFLGNNHVANACSCLPLPADPCPALLASSLLVRATIMSVIEVVTDEVFDLDPDGEPNDQAVTNFYSVKIEEVYVNADAPNKVVAGQTIEVTSRKAGNLCGTTLPIDSDMLLDLWPRGGGTFSTGSCSKNSGIDSNGKLTTASFNKCFEKTLDLAGLDNQYDGVWLLQQLKVGGVLVPQAEQVVISLRKRKDATGPGEYSVSLLAEDRFFTQIKIESLTITEDQKRVDQIVNIASFKTLPSVNNGLTGNLVATNFSTLTKIELENNGNLELSSADGDTTFLCESLAFESM
eukprot:scaffold339149_cov61-Attheya_sp.AAC.2